MSSKDSEARRRAEEKFVKARQREDDVMNSQRQLQQAEAAKLVRLRALRMAKEAAEKQAAETAAAEAAAAGAPAKARRARRPKAEAGSEG